MSHKTWQYICHHNSAKSLWILITFAYLETGINDLRKWAIMRFGLSFSNCMYETRVDDTDELRQHLLHVWHGLEQLLIDDIVDQWPTCLCPRVRANDRHFEHTLWLSICFLCTWWIFMFHTTLDVVDYKSVKCVVSLCKVAWVRYSSRHVTHIICVISK